MCGSVLLSLLLKILHCFYVKVIFFFWSTISKLFHLHSFGEVSICGTQASHSINLHVLWKCPSSSWCRVVHKNTSGTADSSNNSEPMISCCKICVLITLSYTLIARFSAGKSGHKLAFPTWIAEEHRLWQERNGDASLGFSWKVWKHKINQAIWVLLIR